jgi:hypothetical protein
MDTSSLIDSNLERKECGDRLFYDQYRYSLKLRMKDFSCLREVRQADAEMLQVAVVVARRFEQRYHYNKFFNASYRSTVARDQKDLDNLLDLLTFVWPLRDQIKLVFSGDWGYIYSNNKDLLQQIGDKHYVHTYYIKEAVVDRPKDTILLKSSDYRFRSFLRERLCTTDDKNRMLTYLQNQSDIKIGRGLQYWLKYETRWLWTRRYHHFDHNDAKIELMLQLICPGIVRTTMPIIEVNN